MKLIAFAGSSSKTSINKMNENGLILLDDKGSKTELSIPYFKSLGWETVLETNQQIILSR